MWGLEPQTLGPKSKAAEKEGWRSQVRVCVCPALSTRAILSIDILGFWLLRGFPQVSFIRISLHRAGSISTIVHDSAKL